MTGRSSIRTLDLGADKMGRHPPIEGAAESHSGSARIRLSLSNLPLFRTQLRAVLRPAPWATCG